MEKPSSRYLDCVALYRQEGFAVPGALKSGRALENLAPYFALKSLAPRAPQRAGTERYRQRMSSGAVAKYGPS